MKTKKEIMNEYLDIVCPQIETRSFLRQMFDFIFPVGNYRYYPLYLSALVVIYTWILFFYFVANMLINGNVVTGTNFVAASPLLNCKPPGWFYLVLNILMNFAGYGMVIFTFHTGISFMLDVARGIHVGVGMIWEWITYQEGFL
jgi:hypothetical protein